jgi:hypothetical protein
MAKIDETLYLRIPLEEMQRLYNDQKISLDTIKTNIRAVLSAASFIISMVSALQIYTNRIEPAWALVYGLGVLSAAVLYVGLIAVCILGLLPAYPFSPIEANWNTLTTAYKGLSDQQAIELRLSSVLNAIQLNRPIINQYKRYLIIALVLLPLIVIVLLLLVLIPRVVI